MGRGKRRIALKRAEEERPPDQLWAAMVSWRGAATRRRSFRPLLFIFPVFVTRVPRWQRRHYSAASHCWIRPTLGATFGVAIEDENSGRSELARN